MNNNNGTTTTVLFNKDWLDVLLPVLGFAILFLLFILFFNYFIISCYRCTCLTRIKNFFFGDSRTRDSGHDNPNAVNDDLPPTYSVAGNERSSVEIFRVVADDVSDITRWHRSDTEISEKLPSYLEIMEEKQRETIPGSSNEQTESIKENPPCSASDTTNLKEEENKQIQSPHEAVTNSSEDEANTAPPPYSSTLT